MWICICRWLWLTKSSCMQRIYAKKTHSASKRCQGCLERFQWSITITTTSAASQPTRQTDRVLVSSESVKRILSQYGCNFVPRRYFFFISIVLDFAFVSIYIRIVRLVNEKCTQTLFLSPTSQNGNIVVKIKGLTKNVYQLSVQFVCVIPSSGNIYVSS